MALPDRLAHVGVRSGRWLQFFATLGTAVTLATCTSEPTVPNGWGYGVVAVRPQFSTDVNLAALSLPIDRLRLILVRQPDDTVTDTLVTFSLNRDTLRLGIIVRLRQEAETLQATLQLLSGVIPLFLGSTPVEVRAGTSSNGAVTVPVTFVGPGANIATLRITPRDTFLTLGAALQLQLDARDGQGLPVTQFYASWSTAAGSLINGAGVLNSPGQRGNTILRAQLPNGVKDSTRVWFMPLPSALELVSGDGQSGAVGTLLATPLRVRVVAQDGLGVGGIAVRFRGVTGGGFPADTQVVSDTLGFAQVGATLGTLIGAQRFEASVTGLTPVVFNLTATVGIPASIIANSAVTQSAAILAAVTAPPSVLVRDAQTNPVPGVTVTFAITAGGGTILPASTVVTNASGIATLTSWVLGPTVGTNAVQASVTGLTPVSFTATATTGTITQLAILTQPGGILASVGLALNPQPVIQLRDAGGNDVLQAGVVVTAGVASSPGGSVTLFSPSATTAANGRATFSGLSITGLVGNYTVGFTAAGVPGSATSNVIALAVGAVSPSLSTVAVALLPPSFPADSSATGVVTVTVKDVGGNPIPGATVVLAVTGTGNVIAQPATVTNTSGVATGSFVTVDPGAKTVSATANAVAITQTVLTTATTPVRVVFGGDSLGGPPSGIFRVNTNATVRRNISTLGTDFSNPRFSPDGSRVVFAAIPAGGVTTGIHIAATDGSGFVPVVTDTASRFPRYNANGTHIAFMCGPTGFINREVCVVPNVNGALASLTNKGNGAGKIILTRVLRALRGGPDAFAWNPTNPNQIATVRDTVLGANTVLRLFISNFDGSGSVFPNGVPLILGADSSIVVQEMSWSPNGQFLILAAEVNFQRKLYFINANGTGLRQMTTPGFTPQEVEDAHPEISPDNTKVLFLRNSLDFEGSLWDFYVMPVTGNEASIVQVTAETPFGQNSDAVTGDWTPDGLQFVLTGSRAAFVTNVFIMPSTTTSANYLVNRQPISGGANRSDGAPSIRP